jgi:hypothetical protein
MRPLLILAARLIATPIYAADEVVNNDGTVLNIENTKDAIATETAPPTKLEGSSDSDLLVEPTNSPFGRSCSHTKIQPFS